MTLPNTIVDPAKLPWSDNDLLLSSPDASTLRRSADLVLSSRKASMRSIHCERAHHLKNVTAISGKLTAASIHQLSTTSITWPSPTGFCLMDWMEKKFATTVSGG